MSQFKICKKIKRLAFASLGNWRLELQPLRYGVRNRFNEVTLQDCHSIFLVLLQRELSFSFLVDLRAACITVVGLGAIVLLHVLFLQVLLHF